jgi:amino acid transporter
VLANWLALGGMLSALALFNALLLAYSRIPLAMATDRLLPAALGKTDARGTPRNAVLVAAVCYSIFALLPFGELVVADVLLYTTALVLEFAALMQLRRREPTLRGAFRIPVGTGGVVALAMSPVVILAVVVWLSLRDGANAQPSLIGAVVGLALGPLMYRWALSRNRHD